MNQSAVSETYGWAGANGAREIEPTYEPDFAAAIDGDEDKKETDFSLAAEGLREILTLVFAKRQGSNAPVKLDLVFRRFICLVWLVRPELLNCVSLSELSTHLHVTRAALSKMVRNYGDALGLRNALMKRESAREIYARAQKRDHWRYRDKKKPAAPCEATGSHDEHLMNRTNHSEGST